MKAHERRMAILDVLIKRGRETTENLMFEFGVARSTLQRDIMELSFDYPIYTESGRYTGGIFIDPEYKLKKAFINEEELELLTRLSVNLAGKDLEVMERFLKQFTKRSNN